MSLSAKQNTESLVIDTWIRSGKPVLTQLKTHTTAALAFGKPDTKMVQDAYLNKVMPKVTFEGIDKLQFEDGRYFVFPYARNVDAGSDTARGSAMLAARSTVATDPFDALKFQSSWYVINYEMSNDKLDELKGTKFALNGTFASNVADAIMRNYLDKVGLNIWGVGANRMPGDGILGSIRAQVSDGLTNAQRGSGGNETNYANFLGFDRTANTDFSATYQYQSGAALSVLNLETACDSAMNNGATKVVVPLRPARYRKLEDTIRSAYGTNSLKVDEELMNLGIGSAMQFSIGGITCYIDYDIPQGTWVTALDLPSISAGSDFAKVNTNLIPNPAVVNGSLLQGRFRHQMMVTNPRACTLIENLESL